MAPHLVNGPLPMWKPVRQLGEVNRRLARHRTVENPPMCMRQFRHWLIVTDNASSMIAHETDGGPSGGLWLLEMLGL
jgi:hypothetical protein